MHNEDAGQEEKMNTKAISIVFPVAVATAGGVYFGLFSCGGYALHKSLYSFVLVLLTIICSIVIWKKSDKSKSTGKAIATLTIWLILVWATYNTCEAAAASFYPDSPKSLSDFWKRFLICFKYGPC